jgi:hypothetical protein
MQILANSIQFKLNCAKGPRHVMHVLKCLTSLAMQTDKHMKYKHTPRCL